MLLPSWWWGRWESGESTEEEKVEEFWLLLLCVRQGIEFAFSGRAVGTGGPQEPPLLVQGSGAALPPPPAPTPLSLVYGSITECSGQRCGLKSWRRPSVNLRTISMQSPSTECRPSWWGTKSISKAFAGLPLHCPHQLLGLSTAHFVCVLTFIEPF